MSKKQRNTFKRKYATRNYKPKYWIVTEGKTEQDYFNMNAFKDAPVIIKLINNAQHSDPLKMLDCLKKAIKGQTLREEDELWVVIDVDKNRESEFKKLLAWEQEKEENHLAISNPKFELFLVMHFGVGSGSGCTTPEIIDSKMSHHFDRYEKNLKTNQFTIDEIKIAVKNAQGKRLTCSEVIPDAGMTDVYKLVKKLLGIDDV